MTRTSRGAWPWREEAWIALGGLSCHGAFGCDGVWEHPIPAANRATARRAAPRFRKAIALEGREVGSVMNVLLLSFHKGDLGVQSVLIAVLKAPPRFNKSCRTDLPYVADAGFIGPAARLDQVLAAIQGMHRKI